MAGAELIDSSFVQVLTLKVDPSWRLRSDEERDGDTLDFRRVLEQGTPRVRTITYSMVGLRPDADLLLVRVGPTLDALEEAASLALRTGVGRFMSVAHSLVGLLRPSRYVRKPTSQEQALLSGERAPYLVVYPFAKTTEWYRLSQEARQGMMNEHIRVGHEFPQVRQLLAYSTGLADQEFIVAYEIDDLVVFQDLVTALRETEARRYTLTDQPILTAIHRPVEDALRLLG